MAKLLSTLFIFTIYLVEAILVFRFILRLLGANAQAPVVSWVYENSQPLLQPFLFAFPQPRLQGMVLEFTTLFAIVAYAIGGYILQELFEILDKNFNKPTKSH